MDRSTYALLIISLLATPALAQDRPTTPAAPHRKPAPTIDELLLFHPSKHPQGNWRPRDLKYEDIEFSAADGTRLHGWFCPAANPVGIVLYLHGNAGNVTHRASMLRFFQSELRLSTFVLDYRGYGKSEGVASVRGAVDDAKSARKMLATKLRIPESKIILMGRSLGGAIAIELAAQSPPRGLIIESTFSSLREIANDHFPALSWLVPTKKLNSRSRIAVVKAPILHSHGDRDRTVPFAHGEKLFAAAKAPKKFITITKGTHNSTPPPDYYRELSRFVSTLPR